MGQNNGPKGGIFQLRDGTGDIQWSLTGADPRTVEITTQRADTSAPIGKCIYCLGTENLGREHVLPMGLGGGMILHAASCDRCAAITHAFEGAAIHTFFASFRERRSFPKNKKTNRPTHLPVKLHFGSRTEIRNYPISEYPDYLHMPLYDMPPAMFYGTWCHPLLITRHRLWYNETQMTTFGQKVTEETGADQFGLMPNSDHLSFVRLLSKMAHGVAIRSFGLGSFRPLLLDLILKGDLHDAHHLIGCDFHDPGQTDELPHVRQHMGNKIYNFGGRHFIGTSIQLMGSVGMPQYLLMSGEIDDDSPILRARSGA